MKKVIALAIIFTMSFSLMSFASENDIKVILDGTALSFDQPPVMLNDRVLVPLRAIFEALNADVEWNESTSTITSTKDDTVVIMQIGNNVFTVNGTEKELDVPPQLIGERTLVPVRAIAESFDCKVDWDNDTETVIITSGTKITVSKSSISETVYKETTPVAELNGYYPQLSCDDDSIAIDTINEKIKNALTEDLEMFKSTYIESGVLTSSDVKYEVDYGITNMQNNLFSVLFTSSVIQDAEVSVSQFSKVYKLDSGEEAALTDYIPDMTYDEIVSMFVINFTEVIAQEPELYYDNAAEIVAQYIDYAVVYPCGEEIAVTFNPGVIAPYELGFKTLTYVAEN